jgi:hypothetical protein
MSTKDFNVSTTVQTIFVQPVNPTNPAKSGLVFASRTLNSNNQLISPLSNNTPTSLFVPFELPAFTTGTQALAYLKQLGFQYTLGTGFDTSFIPPDTVEINSVSGLTTLIWNDPLMGIQFLVGQNPVGTAVQNTSTANGSIIDAYIASNQSFLVISPTTGSADFDTTNDIVITANLTNDKPDPTSSDEICVFAYAFYNQYGKSPIFNTSPNLWCSVYVKGHVNSITATNTATPLVAPTSAVVQPDGSVNLTYPIIADQLGLLPSVYLGNSTITQDTSTAKGVLNGYTLTSTTCVINVIDVVGTFDDTNICSVVLDNTQTGFNYLGENQISTYGLCYQISNLTTLTGTHSDFYSNIVALQAPSASETNKFNVQGYYSYVAPSINAIPLNALTTPNNTYFVANAKLDVPTAVQYPANNAMVVAVSMFDDLNNEYPYYGTNGKNYTVNLTASANKASYPNNASLNQLTNQGWKAFGVNGADQVYIYRNVCTLQNVNGIVDNSFRFEDIQLKTRYLNSNFYTIAEITVIDPITQQRLNNNPELITNMQNNLSVFLNNAYDNGRGIVGNTKNSVTVTLNPVDVSRLAIRITTTIVPANSGSDIETYVYGYTI